MEIDDDEEEYDGDGWCMSCGDEFHYDDCGGYNPPCECGFHCRSCHEAEETRKDDYERDEDDYEDSQRQNTTERYPAMFDKEMQDALMADAQKLRDEGVDCPDPIFLTDFERSPECDGFCQYALDVDMPGAQCGGRCQYLPVTPTER